MPNSRSSSGSVTENAHVSTKDGAVDHPSDLPGFRDWFAAHFSLDSKPYTLDLDQARAVLDDHKHTLVTARAGSGKTRVIVAKIAYLLATKQLTPSEIIAFMFNRTAAQEVNQRIAKVEFQGRQVIEMCSLGPSATKSESQNSPAMQEEIRIASTFHKFALDILRLSGIRPALISAVEHDQLVERSLRLALANSPRLSATNIPYCAANNSPRRISPREFSELLKTVSGFVARAGQKYTGTKGLEELRAAVKTYTENSSDPEKVRLHRIALATFENYLAALHSPKLDFNLMMSEASNLLRATANTPGPILARTAPLKLILIDEYQDFSQLFLNLVQSLRLTCPTARLFAVGDDWQAINRFAGSDVEYFTNFTQYFPEDAVNIPLMTNYRSCRRIVENANEYMLANYDPKASRATAFNRHPGKIIRQNPEKTRFDSGDIYEDALSDARYQIALARATSPQNHPANIQNSVTNPQNPAKISSAAAKLLKTTYRILRHNRHKGILLLHRHNFTTFPGITLETFRQALGLLAVEEGIMDAETFVRQVRALTIHKSKGLEAEVVILLEANRDLILGHHPDADLWTLFGDSLTTEKSDQHRLLYVAMTRAKQKLYILSSDRQSPL